MKSDDPGGRGKLAYRTVRVGLGVCAFFELASIPLALLASKRLDAFVALDMIGVGGDTDALARADGAFHATAGTFYMARALAEAGLVVGFVAGLFWLHGAWSIAQRRTTAATMSPRDVVLWTLVPVWGLVRVHGFVLQIAKACSVSQREAGVDRWWWTLAISIVLHFAMIRALGWTASLSAAFESAAALLGIRLIGALEVGLARRARGAPASAPAS